MEFHVPGDPAGVRTVSRRRGREGCFTCKVSLVESRLVTATSIHARNVYLDTVTLKEAHELKSNGIQIAAQLTEARDSHT